jgi:hypothetical protein
VVGLLGVGGGGLIWSILVAILGTAILIWITRLIKKEVRGSRNSLVFSRIGNEFSCQVSHRQHSSDHKHNPTAIRALKRR